MIYLSVVKWDAWCDPSVGAVWNVCATAAAAAVCVVQVYARFMDVCVTGFES